MVLILLVRLLLSSSLSLSFQPSSLSNPGSPFSIFQFIFFEPFPVPFTFPSAYFWLLSFWNWALLSWYEIVSRSIIASKEETNALSSVTLSPALSPVLAEHTDAVSRENRMNTASLTCSVQIHGLVSSRSSKDLTLILMLQIFHCCKFYKLAWTAMLQRFINRIKWLVVP